MKRFVNPIVYILLFFLISLSGRAQLRFGMGIAGGYSANYTIYNRSAMPAEMPLKVLSARPFVSTNIVFTQKDVLYFITGVTYYKAYYGFTDNLKTQVVFAESIRDIPLTFGVLLGQSRKGKTKYYAQGGMLLHFYKLSSVFEKYSYNNNNASFGSNFGGNVAYTEYYTFTNNKSSGKYYLTYVPQIGINCRKELNKNLRLDYGFSFQHIKVLNDIKVEQSGVKEQHQFTPSYRESVFFHLGLYFYFPEKAKPKKEKEEKNKEIKKDLK